MSNPLTGDYDAVLQVSVRQINGLMATVHQNGGIPGKSPHFPHSVRNFRVGDFPAVLSAEVREADQWLAGVVDSLRESSDLGYATPLEIGEQLASKSPPGIAASIRKSLGLLELARKGGTVKTGGATTDPLTGLITLPDGTTIDPLEPNSGATIDPTTGIVTGPDGTVLFRPPTSGWADIQISNPMISLPEGTTSEVIVHVFIRAHFRPDPDSGQLPEPIHGEVRITYHVEPVTTPDGKKVLRIKAPTEDGKIRFIPEPTSPGSVILTLNSAEVEQLLGYIRKAVRETFKASDVELPPDFQFFQFKGLGRDSGQPRDLTSGLGQVLALPMQLSGAPPPPSGPDSVTNLLFDPFSQSENFAIGVSREYVTTVLQGLMDSIKTGINGFSITTTVSSNVLPNIIPSIDVVFHAQLTRGPDLEWKNGSVELSGAVKLSGRVEAGIKFDLPDQSLSFVQSLSLEVDPASSTVTLKANGDPVVHESALIPHDKAVEGVKSARDLALNSASGSVNAVFADALHKLRGAHHSFDDSRTAKYLAVEIKLDGLIIRGKIETADRGKPFADFEHSDAGYSALPSWIPGGRITRLSWSYVTSSPIIFVPGIGFTGGNDKFHAGPSTRHSFIFVPESGFGPIIRECLSYDGIQIGPDGNPSPVQGFDGMCLPELDPPFIPWTPDELNGLHIPITSPDPVSPLLEDSILGHVDVTTEHPINTLSTNHLVFFPDWQAERPLEALHHVLGGMRRRQLPLTVVAVLPVGGLKMSRPDFNTRAGLNTDVPALKVSEQSGASSPVRMQFTEDYEGRWSKAFDAKGGPAAFLINARGDFVWSQQGGLDPALLAAALDEHSLDAPAPRSKLMQLAVRPGEPVPEAFFQGRLDGDLALRRKRGQRILLSFWQSWSQPCLTELRRLQTLHEQGDAPFIAAFCGDPEPEALDGIRVENELSIAIVHDSHQQMARLFKVRCWPTTISINEHGIVDHIQFGKARVHRAEFEDKPRETD